VTKKPRVVFSFASKLKIYLCFMGVNTSYRCKPN